MQNEYLLTFGSNSLINSRIGIEIKKLSTLIASLSFGPSYCKKKYDL